MYASINDQMDAVVLGTGSAAYSHEPPPIERLKPALASIKAACDYMGGISRAKFYADVLPLLETVKFGNRNLVVVASMDRLIASRSRPSAPPEASQLRRLLPPVAEQDEPPFLPRTSSECGLDALGEHLSPAIENPRSRSASEVKAPGRPRARQSVRRHKPADSGSNAS
jgi:hypothetical protein